MAFKVTDGLQVGKQEVIDPDGKIDHGRLKNIPTLGIAGGGTGATTAAAAIAALGGLPTAGGTMTGFITLHADPTNALHPATKGYVDLIKQKLDPKDSVRCATTANITLSGTQTIDGVAVVAGNRVLVKNQTAGQDNGIYVVAAGAWTRATDADLSSKVNSGMFTYIEEGATQSATQWFLTTPDPITLGTTVLTFGLFSTAGNITAGAGMTRTGNTVDVVGTANRITVNADSVDIASTYVGQTSITTLGTITTGTWNGTAIAIANGGTGSTTAAGALTALGAAPLASPALTGTPTAPTAAAGTNTTQIATTAFVTAAVSTGVAGSVTSFNTRTGAVTLSSTDVTTALNFTPTRRASFATSPEASVYAIDLRSVANPTADIGYGKGVRFRFGHLNDVDTSGGYADIIELQTYQDASAGGFNALYFGKTAGVIGKIYHKYANAGATTWTSKQLAYTTDNVSQFTNDVNYLKATSTVSLDMNGNNISGVNQLTFQDPGINEGIAWLGGNGWQICEAPDALTDAAGNLQFVGNGSRKATVTTGGFVDVVGGFIAPLGTAAVPSYSFSGDSNTGIYASLADTLAVAVGGAQAATFDVNGLDVNNHLALGSASISQSIEANIRKTWTANNSPTGIHNEQTVTTEALNANRTYYGTLSRINIDTTTAHKGIYSNTMFVNYNELKLGAAAGSDVAVSAGYALFNHIAAQAGAAGAGADLRASMNQITHSNAMNNADSYGSFNYILLNGTYTGTVTEAYGTYNRLDRDAGTLNRAFGVYNSFEGTMTKKIGFYNVGSADIDLGAPTTSSITIGHFDGGSTTTPRLTIDTSGNVTIGGNLTIGQTIHAAGDGKGIKLGDAMIESVSTTEDDIVIRSSAVRFGSATSTWSYSEWAGMRWDNTNKILTIGGSNAGTAAYWISGAQAADTIVNFAGLINNGLQVNGSTVWHAGNDGAGSGLDADTLDGLNNTSFLRSDTANTVNIRIATSAGQGINFWDNDAYKIYMSDATNTTWGGRVAGEATSDYNMYFKMGGGVNRGFVFMNGTTPVAGIDASGNIRGIGQLVMSSGITATTLTLSGALSGATTIAATTSLQAPSVYANSTLYVGNSSANYITGVGAAAGSAPTIASAGSDTNVGLTISPKGTGSLTVTGGTMYAPTIQSSMAVSPNAGFDTSSFRVSAGAGTGDANMAMMAFYHPSYAIKMGIRADGYFGIGGWSRANWSWYTDPSGNMVAAGNVTAYSDPRLKENFQRVQDPLGLLRKLDGGTFNWKSGIEHTAVKAGKRDYGVLADQVEAVMPEIVTESVPIEGESYKTVAYEKLVPVLIEAVKELEAKIAALEARLAS